MIEEHETQETNLKDLIDLVERDDLPTNEFTIEDKDPMVILGKLNEVIAYLQTLQGTINASDSKANEALQKAIQAVAAATQALSVANGIDAKATQALDNAIEAVGTANTALSASNTALSTANTAISTANTALSSANSAVETAENALDTAESAETKADTAITTANGAKTTAEGIDAKATTALANSQTAVSTANTAETKAQEALSQVVAGQGTKVYRDTQLLTSLDIKPIEENIANNTTAINNEATTRANAINALDDAKVDKVSGKQLSTEDYTTAEKTKLAGLYNYNDTQVKADITALQTRATNIETKNTEQDTAIANEVTARTNADNNKADRNNANQSIVAGSVTAPTGDFSNINETLQSVNSNITTLLSRGATALWSGNITTNTNNLSINSMSDYNFIMAVGNSTGGTNDSTILPMPYFVQKRQLYINLNTPNNTRGIGVTYVNDTKVNVSITSATLLAIYGIK